MLANTYVLSLQRLTIDLHFLPQLCLAALCLETIIAYTARHLAGVDEAACARIIGDTWWSGRVF